MAYDKNITIKKFAKDGPVYGIIAGIAGIVIAYIPILGQFLQSLPPEYQTAKLVLLMGIVSAVHNYISHKDD